MEISKTSLKTTVEWNQMNWQKLERRVFKLQRRIYKASSRGDTKAVRRLQKTLSRSWTAKCLAVRKVTQDNQGKKTAGVDGVKSLTPKQRLELVGRLKLSDKAKPTRRVWIPKPGTTEKRPLGIPTIADRAWQCLAKYALEPAHEATFHARSYGFRPGRSAHDAQKQLFLNLSASAKGINKRVIELDIEKCFDRISHTTIMDNLIVPKGVKTGIFRCLKAGTNPEFPEQGTPQGGVISPLLANIALNGIESIHRYKDAGNKVRETSVRYADDMVIVLRPQDNAVEILDKIDKFLAARGMKISQKKTKTTAATDGFDFLGWHFKVQSNGKFKSTPSVDNYKKFRQKVKAIVNNSNYGSTVKAEKLAPIVRGWRNYHKFCKMNGARFTLWHINHRTWKVFNKETKNDRESTTKLVAKAFPTVPYSENRHVSVKGCKSPFDGDTVYWSKRNSKLYTDMTSKALNRQNHACGICGLKCTSEERVHLHHIDRNHNNWKTKNLTAVHESCHDYIHMSKR